MILGVIIVCYISIFVKAEKLVGAPALYVLGDSILDSGNNNLLPTSVKANFMPYGANFPTGPTGRFTNGRTVADFLAEYLGLPFAPPYMSFHTSTSITTGFNYASSSCGILFQSGKFLGNCLSLSEQTDYFGRTVEEELPKHFENAAKLSDYLSKSIFLISIGSNDYINNYLEPHISDSSQRYSPQSFANLLIHNLSQQLQKLHKLGARKMVVIEIGPLGCLPLITGRYNNNGQCAEEINRLVIMFNDQLATMLTNLTSILKGSSFVIAPIHSLAYDAIINPSKYGLMDSTRPCCMTIWMNGTATCIPELQPCNNADKSFFWDGIHPTETVYSLLCKTHACSISDDIIYTTFLLPSISLSKSYHIL